MTETQRDFDLEYLDLLKQNYDNLHKSVWEAHKVAWTMTSIFVPVLVAAVGIFLKDSSGLKDNQVLFGVYIAIVVVWFWYGMLCLLRGYNEKKTNQLKSIEKVLNAYYSELIQEDLWPERVKFSQYAKDQKKRETVKNQKKRKPLKKFRKK